ncbi:carboxypeptidase regulatory-like domain-containing protein [bacterium]|nr:carboxypeptidase regulatory-like domain-containing protein [candidate division CSSED10-310 bacterium]
MKHNHCILLALLLLVMAGGCTEDFRGTIDGQVRASEFPAFGPVTPLPVPDVLITAESLKTGRTVESYTGTDGYYELHDVQFGLNEMRIYKEGYDVIERYADVEKDQTTTVNFLTRREPNSTDVNAKFLVLSEDGRPVADAVLDLFELAKGEYSGTDTLELYLETAYTNEQGKAVMLEVSEVDEFRLKSFLVKVAAVGYYNTENRFVLAYGKSNVNVTVVLEPIQ